jgi:hypothetical protein
MRRIASVAVCALMAVGTACAPTLRVTVLQPASVNLGAATRLTLVQTEGRRSAQELVAHELMKQARERAYFQVTDRSDEGFTIKVVGQSVQVSGGSGAGQAPDEVGLRVDVLDWNATREVKKVDVKDDKGNVVGQDEVQVFIGKVVLGVTAFNNQGRAFLAEREFEGRWENDQEDPAIRAAARAAVSHLLYAITPIYVQRAIRMDGEDKAQEPIIKVAQAGNIGRAVEEMRAYVQQHPQNAAALYNLATLLDASAQYKEALELYSQAIALSNKDFYVDNKAECARRMADQEAMSR